MPEPKPSYKLKIKIDSARADAIADALGAIHEIAGDQSVAGDQSTTITLEAYTEAPLLFIRAEFEKFLWNHKIGMECKIGLEGPGIRPEMTDILQATPMDRILGFADKYSATVEFHTDK